MMVQRQRNKNLNKFSPIHNFLLNFLMFKKSILLKIFCLCFILGVLLANFVIFNFDVFYLFVILIAFLILSIIFWQNKKIGALVFAAAAFFVLGAWRVKIDEPRINNGHIG